MSLSTSLSDPSSDSRSWCNRCPAMACWSAWVSRPGVLRKILNRLERVRFKVDRVFKDVESL